MRIIIVHSACLSLYSYILYKIVIAYYFLVNSILSFVSPLGSLIVNVSPFTL